MLVVNFGPMFSGKSSDLFMAKQKGDPCYKPEMMKDYVIKSRDFGKIQSDVFDYRFHECERVFFDEFQFFDPKIKNVIREYLDNNVDVYIYGLRYDSNGNEFNLNILNFGLEMRREKYKVYIKEFIATCYKCNKLARHTKYLDDKKDQVKLGSIGYQPCCIKCL